MGLALLPFLGLWVLMMAAMMLPSVAPVGVLWTRLIAGATTGLGRVVRMAMFLGGYLLAWAVAGIVVYAALRWRWSSSPKSSAATASHSPRPSGWSWWRSASWPSGSR